MVLILLLHFPTLWVVLVIWYYLVASKSGWMGWKGGWWDMKFRWPCFRPGWGEVGVGSCPFICSVDSAQSLGIQCYTWSDELFFVFMLRVWFCCPSEPTNQQSVSYNKAPNKIKIGDPTPSSLSYFFSWPFDIKWNWWLLPVKARTYYKIKWTNTVFRG